MFIPNGTQTGDWDLNLTEKFNANVDFTKVVPVPAENGDGFFDWDEETEAVTLNALQKGKFNLFDAAIDLAKFASCVPMLGESEMGLTVPAIKPKRILAHWDMTVTMHHGPGTHHLKVGWDLFTGRRKTV